MIKILFVCLGNICRSPTAHAIMEQKIQVAGLSKKFYIDSAGTGNYHQGQLPDSRMRQYAAQRGYALQSRARQITQQDVKTFDMIITMDEHNYADVKKMLSIEQLLKLHRLSDFSQSYEFLEVPDPYYGGAKGFSKVLDLLEDACAGLLKKLN